MKFDTVKIISNYNYTRNIHITHSILQQIKMGLDMIAFACKEELPNTYFEMPENFTELQIWRKHPDLHGWMENLYVKKNNIKQEEISEFNTGTCVQLTLEDLQNLELDIKNNKLPKTEGFFFGESYNNKKTKANDLEFIKNATSTIKAGLNVYYTSWW